MSISLNKDITKVFRAFEKTSKSFRDPEYRSYLYQFFGLESSGQKYIALTDASGIVMAWDKKAAPNRVYNIESEDKKTGLTLTEALEHAPACDILDGLDYQLHEFTKITKQYKGDCPFFTYKVLQMAKIDFRYLPFLPAGDYWIFTEGKEKPVFFIPANKEAGTEKSPSIITDWLFVLMPFVGL